MQIDDAVDSFHSLGGEIRNYLEGKAYKQEEWEKTIQLAEHENPWFTQKKTQFLHLGVYYYGWMRKF